VFVAVGLARDSAGSVVAGFRDRAIGLFEFGRLVGSMRQRGRASGVEVASVGAAGFTLREGKVTCLTLYQTSDEALKAVGLEE
jgi:hypothetical protein